MNNANEKLYSCYICKRKLPRDSFRPDHGRKTGIASKCNDCRAYYESNLRPKKKRKRKLDSIKEHARYIIKKMLKDGIIKREVCAVCGIDKTQAHHKDYTKPTDVQWLCRKHHSEQLPYWTRRLNTLK